MASVEHCRSILLQSGGGAEVLLCGGADPLPACLTLHTTHILPAFRHANPAAHLLELPRALCCSFTSTHCSFFVAEHNSGTERQISWFSLFSWYWVLHSICWDGKEGAREGKKGAGEGKEGAGKERRERGRGRRESGRGRREPGRGRREPGRGRRKH